MKLNPDCIRDVLIYLEENLEYVNREDVLIEHREITLSTIKEELHTKNSYEYIDIIYSVEKLIEVDYITASHINRMAGNSKYIDGIADITWQGHQFLNTIRPKTVWEATKKGASKLGIMSMHALATIAGKVADVVVTNPDIINQIATNLK